MRVGIVGACQSGLLSDLLPESGGVDLGCGGYLIATLVRALVGRGHHVSVITLSPEIKEGRILQGRKLNYYVYPMRTRRRMRDLYKIERQGLRQGILLAKPQILHAHWTYEWAMACLETGLPTLVTSHDNALQVLRFTKDLYRLGRLYLQIRVLRQARFVTAVSPYLADSLNWLTKRDINVVPNPVEVSNKPSYSNVTGARPVRIATVINGWQKLKNSKSAIIAFGLLRREVPDAQMFMYGHDYEERGPASKWAEREGLSANIHFCGFLPPRELQNRLSGMSILLHPALEEACPMAILEAMALGLPAVAGIKSGGVPWVLDYGRAGFLTDVRNPRKITEALLTCIKDAEDRKRKQRHAYDRVLSVFSPNSVAAQYERIYEKVVSRERAPRRADKSLACRTR